jgi:hypothetical protein
MIGCLEVLLREKLLEAGIGTKAGQFRVNFHVDHRCGVVIGSFL